MAKDIERINFERSIAILFFDVANEMNGKYISFQLMRDDDFMHRRDRHFNDIHLFLELNGRGYFHLKGYTRHMLEHPELIASQRVYLTGYLKSNISKVGGTHSLRQDWYKRDPKKIAEQIIVQARL